MVTYLNMLSGVAVRGVIKIDKEPFFDCRTAKQAKNHASWGCPGESGESMELENRMVVFGPVTKLLITDVL